MKKIKKNMKCNETEYKKGIRKILQLAAKIEETEANNVQGCLFFELESILTKLIENEYFIFIFRNNLVKYSINYKLKKQSICIYLNKKKSL